MILGEAIMKVRYTPFVGNQAGRTVTLNSDDPYATTGITTRADGWTYCEYDVRDRKDGPLVVVSVHHDVTGHVIGVYEWATARVARPDEFPALRECLSFDF
jgi:hypothetical protein